MKINSENLLGSAQKINSKRGNAAESEKSQSGVRADKADIAAKVDSRLDSIQIDMRELQTELSKNQIIKEGLLKTVDTMNRGGNISAILEETRFNDKKVLLDFLGEDGDTLTMQMLDGKNIEIDKMITRDVNKLSKLQVESENILASNLSKGAKSEAIMQKIDEIIGKGRENPMAALTSVQPETVMRLIR